MMEMWKSVNGVPSKVLCYGKGVEEDLSKVRHLVLIVPGNPGVIDFYKECMEVLHKRLTEKCGEGQDIPVWGICHAGHQRDDLDEEIFPSLKDNENLYSLDGQIRHKFEFIKTYIPSHIRIIGVGHSIGCKIWSEVVKLMDATRNDNDSNGDENGKPLPEVGKCFMLFPTMERMRDTPNGKLFVSRVRLFWLVEPLLNLIVKLPTAVHRSLLRTVLCGQNVPDSVLNAGLRLFHPSVVNCIIHMAKCEMDQVLELDVETLERNLQKFFFYFGTTDDWMPLEYVEDMKKKFPNMHHKICEDNIPHAFVMEFSELMGKNICIWMDDLVSSENEECSS